MATPTSQPMHPQNFKCVKCKKDSFKTAKALATHQEALNHHAAVCQKCNKEFASKNALKQHKATHRPKLALAQKPLAAASPKPTPTKQPARGSSATPAQSQQGISEDVPSPTLITGAVATSTTQTTQLFVTQQHQPAVIGETSSFTQAFTHIDIPPLDSHRNAISGIGGDPLGFYHNGNYYTTLSTLEQDLLFKYLLARCHSPSRLQAQGYQLPGDAVDRIPPQPHKQPAIKRSLFRQSPLASPKKQKRRAIVLDCEMVEVRGYQRELAFLSAVDFLTGEVLINKYVEPTAKVTSWNSRVSGITPSAMARAIAKNEALRKWQAARAALWDHIDAETVLIGHSLNSDLKVLGMLHWRVVDSSVLTGEAVFITESMVALRRTWALKKLVKTFLSMEIQNSKSGHNCLEDTLATREVVIWCLRNPEHLKTWADIARAQDRLEQEQREAKRLQKEQEKKKKEEEEEKKKKKEDEGKKKKKKKTEDLVPQQLVLTTSTIPNDEDFDTDISELLGWGDQWPPRADTPDAFWDSSPSTPF